MNWLGRISRQRTQAQGGGADAPKAGGKKAGVDPQTFAATLLSDKVLARHGASLAPAAGDMKGIAQAAVGLHTHQAAQFARSVDQFYASLGRSTDHLPADTRAEVVTASVKAMRGLVEKLAGHPALMPAMAALSSMLEPRGKLDVGPAQHAQAAQATLLDLIDRLEARQGLTSMLFGFRNMVESYEGGLAGLKASDRPAIWGAVTGYLEDVVPRSGCDQGELGRIVGGFQRALRETPDDPAGALTRARDATWAQTEPSRAAAKQQLQFVPDGLAAGSPAKQAYEAITEALTHAVDVNPAASPALLQAIELVHAQAQAHAPAVDAEDVATAYASMGKLIRLASETGAGVTVLSHLAQNLPGLADNAAARGVLARVGQMKKAESAAGLLVEAHLALIGRDPEQVGLTQALGKLTRLPAGPALRAAVAALPYLGDPNAAALIDFLFVQSRVTETPEALTELTQRFMTALPHLTAQLGEDAAPVAGALAKDGAGPLVPQIAQQAAAIGATVKGILPNVPLAKLLDQGRGGEAGLLRLCDKAAFIHDPAPIAYELLRAVAEGPKADVAEARLAVHIAAELGRLDRNPQQTELPKVLEDFRAALADPKALTSAPAAAGAAAAIKAGPPSDLPAFLAAHPKLPAEVAATAGRALSAGQMAWLNRELESTRSMGYARVLRDVVFAAVKTGRVDLVDALSTSPSDRKAVEAAATLIAREHRGGKADQLPFDRLIEGLKAGEDPVTTIAGEQAAAALGAIGLDAVANPSPEGMAVLEAVKPHLQNFFTFFNTARHGKEGEFFLQILRPAIQAHADGTWPAPKYESESAREHLKGLSPEQIAIWGTADVTGADAPPALDDPEKLEAVHLLRGVHKTLSEHVTLNGPGFEKVEWNQASFDDLLARQKALLAGLRDAKKGSPEHRALSTEIGPVVSRVAILELHLALEAQFRGEAQDPQAVLTALKPVASAAASHLRKLGARSFSEALSTAVDAARGAVGNLRTGKYACDDDRVDAYMTAFGPGSCINADTGQNRGCLVEKLTGSQYKMMRAMDGDKAVGRSFLRLLRVELPNGYKGHALRIDRPMATAAGAPSAADTKLMYAHALSKAVAMGIPLLVDDATVQEDAAAKGLAMVPQQAKIFLHHGTTGLHHNEGLGPHYWVGWAGFNVGGAVPAADQKEFEIDRAIQVVMPPNWQPPAAG